MFVLGEGLLIFGSNFTSQDMVSLDLERLWGTQNVSKRILDFFHLGAGFWGSYKLENNSFELFLL